MFDGAEICHYLTTADRPSYCEGGLTVRGQTCSEPGEQRKDLELVSSPTDYKAAIFSRPLMNRYMKISVLQVVADQQILHSECRTQLSR